MTELKVTRLAPREKIRKDAPRRAVGETLLRFGIEPHLSGFDPLCTAIRMTAERKRTDTAQSAVVLMQQDAGTEHALRDALSVGFLGTDEIHTQMFPFSDRPSSSEFVCTIAELLRDHAAQG